MSDSTDQPLDPAFDLTDQRSREQMIAHVELARQFDAYESFTFPGGWFTDRSLAIKLDRGDLGARALYIACECDGQSDPCCRADHHDDGIECAVKDCRHLSTEWGDLRESLIEQQGLPGPIRRATDAPWLECVVDRDQSAITQNGLVVLWVTVPGRKRKYLVQSRYVESMVAEQPRSQWRTVDIHGGPGLIAVVGDEIVAMANAVKNSRWRTPWRPLRDEFPAPQSAVATS